MLFIPWVSSRWTIIFDYPRVDLRSVKRLMGTTCSQVHTDKQHGFHNVNNIDNNLIIDNNNVNCIVKEYLSKMESKFFFGCEPFEDESGEIGRAHV